MLDQSQSTEAGMAVLPDNDMIMHRDVECFGSVDELLGHIDVGARWRWITGRMVVNHAIHYAKTLINKQIM